MILFLHLKSKLKTKRKGTSTAGVHQMRLLHRHSLYHCLQCQSITFNPQKQPYPAFKNNWGWTDGPTGRRTDEHGLLYRYVVASKKKEIIIFPVSIYSSLSSLKILFSLVILASYAVQFMVGHEILFGRVRKWLDDPSTHDRWDIVIRILVITFTLTVAASIPHLGN